DAIPTATLKPKEERRITRGHAWAYRTEFKKLPELEDGDLVDVYSDQRRFVGRGFYQAQGGIAVRMLSRHQEAIDANFFQARIQSALALRRALFPESTAYRWLFAESDGMPGLVADRFGGVVSVQSSCAFYVKWMKPIAELLLAEEGVDGVRFQVAYHQEILGEVPDAVDFELEGLQVQLRLEGAQKTGMFLDQRLNRLTPVPFARDARVLDGHCHLGLWGCHAAAAGAREVIAVDTSQAALDLAQANAERNGVADRFQFRCDDVETVLAEEEPFDIVIVDPPAFAKGRGQAKKAQGRYLQLNRAAIKGTKPGGICVTSSCSHFIDNATFLDIIKRVASMEKRTVQLLELRGAAADHPVSLAMPETAYLKCAVLRVL
ncbi:MAG: class I SAM-dependent rRNA methyltransferase, partial [Candidatus Hydrogenedentes bacterium]|nr:class I SAM-dependent rRNA methyltransferase [Candidatus Hydrogenedentota bacterium]